MAILSYEEASRMAQLELSMVMQYDLIPFLDVAWRFPKLSLENICLLLLQNPNTIEFQTESEWRQSCYSLKSDAQAITLMLEDQTVIYVYDISQTDGTRTETPPDPKQAYNALMKTLGKEPLVLENTKNRIAYYDQSEHNWCVSAKANTDARFYSIVTFLAAQELEQEKNIDSMIANDLVAYMLCKKYGVSTQYINMSNLQTAIYHLTDDTIRRNTIYRGMDCLLKDVFKDLQAYYSDRMMERKLEKDKEADEKAKAEAMQKAAEEARIQELAEKLAQQRFDEMLAASENKGLLRKLEQKLKRGETGK